MTRYIVTDGQAIYLAKEKLQIKKKIRTHPGYVHISKNNNNWTSNKPERVETEEWIVKSSLNRLNFTIFCTKCKWIKANCYILA